MKINSIKVSGEYSLFYEFSRVNILLGENGTGKSTFMKLILYGLGVKIPDFIEEISKFKLCDSLCIDFETKQNKRYSVVRKLPSVDMVTIIPYNEQGELENEEIGILNLAEYSDFLLEEEGYSKEVISYGNGKTATFRYRFLLRTAVVDQSTQHSKVLANLGSVANDYISNQTLVNKAIIEKVLELNNEDAQKIRLELKENEKIRTEINNKIKFYKEILERFRNDNEKVPYKIDRVIEEMEKLNQKREELAKEKYSVLLKLEHVGDANLEKNIVGVRGELNRLKEERTKYKLELIDVDGVLKKLDKELQELKRNIASKIVIQNIPVSICPVCFSKISEEKVNAGLCDNCHNSSNEDILQSLAMYKRMIEDSITEANTLKEEYGDKLSQIEKNIKEKEKKLRKEEEKYFNKLTDMREPIKTLITEITDEIDSITNRYYLLRELLFNLKENNELKTEKKELDLKIKNLHEELDQANKKDSNAVLIYMKWQELFKKIFHEVYMSDNSTRISGDDYMPIIDDNPITQVSSESMKLVARLAYVLSLFELETVLKKEKINSIGFILFDSPKDKDLDLDKYEEFLKSLSDAKNGQIFLTGSVKDLESYKKYFLDEDLFPFLYKDNKLLKKSE